MQLGSFLYFPFLYFVLYEYSYLYAREAYIIYTIYVLSFISLPFLDFSSCWNILSSLSVCYVLDKESLIIRLNRLTSILRQLLERVSSKDLVKHTHT